MNTRVPLSMLSSGALALLLCTPLAAQTPSHAEATTQSAQKPTAAVQPTAASAPTARDAFGPNVRIDVTIIDTAGANAAPVRKTIGITAVGRSSVRSGVNVPFPSTTMGAAGAGGVNTIPVTSYNYRTQGLSLDLRELDVRDNLVRVGLTVEYSPLDEAEKPQASAATPVSYSNFSQSFQLVLENGKPVIAAEMSDPVPNRNRKLSVEVKATVLR